MKKAKPAARAGKNGGKEVMGLFDYVNAEVPCPECGYLVRGFLSKDAGCDLVMLDPTEVDYFYSSCSSCKAWIQFVRKRTVRSARETPFTKAEIDALGFEYVKDAQDAKP